MRLVFSLIVVLMFLSCGRKETTQQKVIENVDVQESKLGVYLQILGTTQDGGSPHTGCQKECCRVLFLAGKSDRKVVSLGLVSTKTNQTWLFEATPDLPFQMQVLQKEIGSTSKTPNGIFLTHAHIGHYTGLMFLGREVMNSKNVSVYVLPRMKSFIESNGPWSQLVDLKNIELKQLKSDSVIQLNAKIRITPISIPHRDEFSETAGFLISGPSKTALFIPDIDKWKKWNRNINEFIAKVDYAFLDATFFQDGEINRPMSEIPHPFITETLKLFENESREVKNKIYFIHFNHTNISLETNNSVIDSIADLGYNFSHFGDQLPL